MTLRGTTRRAMGLLIDGVWQDAWYDTKSTGGRFVRKDSAFRSWVTPEGSPGPTGQGGLKAEPGRYHLYVSLACPWAHRTLIFRALKGLEGMIGLSVVHWRMLEQGWGFEPGAGVIPDPIRNARSVHAGPGPHPAPDPQCPLPARGLHARRARLFGPGHRAGALGQGEGDDRQQ